MYDVSGGNVALNGYGAMSDIYDSRRCELGEGAFWHPERQAFLWCDIMGNRVYSRDAAGGREWIFQEHVSALGRISRDRMIVAGESGLWCLDLETDSRELVAPLPRDEMLRSNDGRADPWGGFWIGTMGKRSEDRAGAIWRYYRGEMRMLYPGLSIPNAICFDAGRELACFADTRLRTIWSVRLSSVDGWPVGEPVVFADLSGKALNPDGAVIDADGNLWNAQWGAGRVACYSPQGEEIGAEYFAAARISCPAFGGADLDMLFATSAQQNMSAGDRLAEPCAGMSFARRINARGVPESRVEI